MLHILTALTVIDSVSAHCAQEGAPCHAPPPPPLPPPPPPPPPPPAPVVIPVVMNPPHRRYSSSSSEERGCGRCDHLKTSCKGAQGKCKEAIIRNFDHRGCKAAIISCPPSEYLFILETDHGQRLSEGGVNDQKMVKCCRRRNKWYARDVRDEKAEFRTVRCIFHEPGHPPYLH